MKQETYILIMEKWFEMIDLMGKWLIYTERLPFAFALETATIRVSRLRFPSNGHGCTIIFVGLCVIMISVLIFGHSAFAFAFMH